MKIVYYLYLGCCLGTTMLLASCGDYVLNKVTNFSPNAQPILTEIEVKNSKQDVIFSQKNSVIKTQLKPEIAPNQLYYLSLSIDDIDLNPIKVEYSAVSIYNPSPNTSNSNSSYICNGDPHSNNFNQKDIGTFNRKIQSDDFEKTITATTTFFLPASLPLESDIYVRLTLIDAKEAQTIQYICLGPVKKKTYH